MQIAPPMVKTKPDSKIEATLLGPPDLKIPSPNLDNYGDPLAKLINGSGGPGGGSGIGSGTGTGIALSRLDACKDARRDGNQKTEVQSFRLQKDAYRVIKGSSMSDCMCEGPAPGGWHNCMVDISVTHTNR